MEEWVPYRPGCFPPPIVVDGAEVPRSVIVEYEDGHQEEDCIFGGELLFHCEKSCTPIYGRLLRWRYQYSKEEFMQRLQEELERRRQRRERERVAAHGADRR